MGPNPLYLLEDLCQNLDLKSGMKVLDMGCGKGLTSIFLAKEYGVTVFANDLWISAKDNLKRFEDAGVSDKVYPIHADAHTLPYAEGFFDVAISVDSYHYYGAGENYFPDVFSKLVKKGGQFGIVVPGLTREFEKGYPDTLEHLWIPELYTFHSKEWWQKLWAKTKLCEVTACYEIEKPKEIWRSWADWAKANFPVDGEFDEKFLDADINDDVTLIVMAAKKN